MAEVLGVVGSIIAIIQITDNVLSYSYQFIGKVRGAEREVNQIISIITGLKGFLEFLQTFVKDDENKDRLPLLHSLCNPDGPLETCKKALADIETRMRPKRDHNGILKAITWPWKWKDIGEVLGRYRKTEDIDDACHAGRHYSRFVGDRNHGK